MVWVSLAAHAQCGVRTERMPGHADSTEPHRAPDFVNHLAPGHFVQRKNHVLQPRQKLGASTQRAQRCLVFETACHAASRIDVTARMLQMHHHQASGCPDVAPHFSPVA